MTIQRTAVDHVALPTTLLPKVKEHLRVRHVRDDALITTYIASAIGLIERKCDVSLDPATYVLTTDELGGGLRAPAAGGCSYTLPLNNANKATVTDEATPPNDLSTDFTIWNPDYGGNGSSFLVAKQGKSLGTGWLITLEVGITDETKLAPAFFAQIARITGSLYENREASSALWESAFDAELMALWRPSA